MTILVFGDSNAHGTVAKRSHAQLDRHPRAARWPEVMALALDRPPDRPVVVEGQPGRTTVFDDPIEGAHKNGLRAFRAVLESHRPVDLVMIVLGTNDCKARFGLRGWDVAAGAGRLAEEARRSTEGPGGGPPDVMLVAPVPVEERGLLAEAFQGARARSRAVAPALEAVAARLGCGFFDAGRHAAVDPVDGVHLTVEAHAALGRAMAEAVRERMGG